MVHTHKSTIIQRPYRVWEWRHYFTNSSLSTVYLLMATEVLEAKWILKENRKIRSVSSAILHNDLKLLKWQANWRMAKSDTWSEPDLRYISYAIEKLKTYSTQNVLIVYSPLHCPWWIWLFLRINRDFYKKIISLTPFNASEWDSQTHATQTWW